MTDKPPSHACSMNSQRMIDRMERFADVLPALVSGVTADDARWKPLDNAWSILEIVSHMADEEVEDFRKRVQLTLEDPGQPWPPIDPEGWAVERRYNAGDLDEVVARFIATRRDSVQWLRSLDGPDWAKRHEHKLSPLRAGDIFTAWVAHDALHLRQIAKRLYQLTGRDAGDYKADYAGSWTA